MNRRDFVAAASSIAFVPSPKAEPYQDPENLRALAVQLRYTLNQIGDAPLISNALRHVAHIRPLVNSRSRDLQHAAAELSNNAAAVLYDARRLDDAERVGGFALALARRSGSAPETARAYENLCLFSIRRDPRRAAEYARRGLTLDDLTAERAARLRARFGAAIAATRVPGAEREARKVLDQAQGADRLTMGVVAGSAGIAFDRFGRYVEADQNLRRAVHLFADSPHLGGLWLTQRVKVALRGGQPAVAADGMRSLTRVVPLVNSTRFDQDVREILRDSGRWATVPEVRSARDQLRAVAPATAQA